MPQVDKIQNEMSKRMCDYYYIIRCVVVDKADRQKEGKNKFNISKWTFLTKWKCLATFKLLYLGSRRRRRKNEENCKCSVSDFKMT